MNTLKIIGILIVLVVALIAMAMVLGVIESTEAKDTGIKVIACLAILGLATELVVQLRK